MLTYQEQEYCKVNVQYQPSAEDVMQLREESFNDLMRDKSSLTIPGFRKGKATPDAIRMHYRKHIDDKVKQKLLTKAVEEYCYETKAQTIFQPQVHSAQLNQNNFECDFTVLQKPKFELGQYTGMDIPKPTLKPAALEVERYLEALRVQHGDTIPYGAEDFVQTGDMVTLDVECQADNELISSVLTQTGVLFTVQEGTEPALASILPQNILGMSAGETREFSEKVHGGTLAKFKVTVHMGVKKVPMPLSDELAHKLERTDYNDLRTKVEGLIGNLQAQEEKEKIQQQVSRRLLNNNSFEVPRFLVDMEVEKMALQANTRTSELELATLDLMQKKATESVKLVSILDAIREVEPDTVFTEQEIIEHLRKRYEDSGMDATKELQALNADGRLYGVIAALQNQAVVDWLISKQNIVE